MRKSIVRFLFRVGDILSWMGDHVKDILLTIIISIVCIALILILTFGIAALITKANNASNTASQPPKTYNDDQELVLEHTNPPDSTGNKITVYCDIPSMDRVYVLNGNSIYVIPGGCKNLP